MSSSSVSQTTHTSHIRQLRQILGCDLTLYHHKTHIDTMSLPKTFKKAVFNELGARLSIEDAPLQLPSRHEVLIKVEACGVCHSDTAVQCGGFRAGL